MAVNCVFRAFAKSGNSTKQPSGGGVSLPCNLYGDCSIQTPQIRVASLQNPTVYNYCYIADFGRYYFVTDWTWRDGIWFADLSVDVLASWRDQIMASTQYVLRSASDYDGAIVDKLYPTKSSQYFSTTTKNTPFFSADSFEDGMFIVGIVNGDSGSAGGGVTYYQMDNAAMQNFRSAMLGSIDWADISTDEISQQLSKALLNPYQYVVSCRWFPFTAPTGGVVENVKFGWWQLPLVTSLMRGQSWYDTDTITLQPLEQHPQIARGSYLNLSPYTTRTLYCYPWGCADLDTTMLAQSTALKFKASIDMITGEGILYAYAVKDDADVLMFTRSAQVGVDVPLTQIAVTPNVSSIGGLVSTAIGAAGSAIAAFLGGGDLGAIGDAALSSATTTETKGVQGGIMAYNQPLRVVSRFFDVADDDVERRGRPLMEPRVLNTLSGYVLCDTPHIECYASAAEIASIERHLSSGVYLE